MAWTTPKIDWNNGELVTADDMNEIGGLLKKLMAPLAVASYTTPSDIVATPRDWSDIDSDNLNFTLDTTGGDVLAHFQGVIHDETHRGHTVGFNLEVDGVRQRGSNGIVSAGLDNDRQNVPIAFTELIRNLSAGTHTFKFQWRSNQERAVRLKKGAQFWVREI
ncbi:MAG: hypothetical protein OXG39_18210 [Chloroflexi bacterium]|nr:hypothetical protein [Chloroflexota bacterium]